MVFKINVCTAWRHGTLHTVPVMNKKGHRKLRSATLNPTHHSLVGFYKSIATHLTL